MSSGDNLKIAYYSALLAKAVQEEDGDKFSELYDQILKVVTTEQATDMVDRAHELSSMAEPTLGSRIQWMESHGACLPSTESCDVVPTAQEEILDDKDASETDDLLVMNAMDNGHEIKANRAEHAGNPADRVVDYIDDDDDDDDYYDSNNDDSLCVSSADPQPMPVVARETNDIMPQAQGDSAKQTKAKLLKTAEEKQKSCIKLKQCETKVDCCVVEMEHPVNFGLASPYSPYGTIDNQPQYNKPTNTANYAAEIEMKEIRREKSDNINPGTGSKREIFQSPVDSDEYGTEQNKKIKKKKKKKSKSQGTSDITGTNNAQMEQEHQQETEANELLDEKSMKSTRNIRRKKLREERKVGSLENPQVKSKKDDVEEPKQPKSSAVEKRRKRTVKSYQEEKEKKSEENHGGESTGLISENRQRSYGTTGNNQKKTEEAKFNPSLLTEEVVSNILKEFGEGIDVSSEPKKKNKDVKKEKKKNKKQKKTDQVRPRQLDRENEKEEKVLKESPRTVSPIVESAAHFSFGNKLDVHEGLPPSGDESEFITPKRSRRPVNRVGQASSGRSSPREPGQRKRRFSDPSPSTHAVHQQTTSVALANSERPRYAIRDDLPVSSNDIYDREQWPTLSTGLADTSPQPDVSARNVSSSSYASKLKTNLDSTGCSLASSSEDGASSSSSSSGGHNFPSNAAGRSSPPNDLELPMEFLTGVTSAVHAAANHLSNQGKLSVKFDNQTPVTVPPCTRVNPANVVEVVQCLNNEKPGTPAAIITTKIETLDTENVQDVARRLPVTSRPKAPSSKTTTNKAPAETEPDEKLWTDEASVVASTVQKQNEPVTVTHTVLPEGLNELFENKWGLEFFTDPSMAVNNPLITFDDNYHTVSNSSVSVPVGVAVTGLKETLIFSDGKLTFGDEDLSSRESEQTLSASAVLELPAPNTTEAATTRGNNVTEKYNMRMGNATNLKPWNDPGNFNLSEATALLLAEFKAASGKATYYRETSPHC